MSGSIDRTRLSKTMAHALRHAPGSYGLDLDAGGWADAEALLDALRSKRRAWRDLDPGDVRDVIEGPGRRRFELRDGRVRALYGHSVEGTVERPRAEPPDVLWHGTTGRAARRILDRGLRPMGRQRVHLSPDRSTAREVGRRRTDRPVVLAVRAAEAHADGVGFYEGGESVWLADPVPARYVERAPNRGSILEAE